MSKKIKRAEKWYVQDQINQIRSGKGAGLGVFLGLITSVTIIGPFIAGLASFGFLNDICNEEYLKNTDAKRINLQKGFFATAIFGGIVGIACCAQWKADMISVLEGKPTAQSYNYHLCFKIWFWIITALRIYNVIAIIATLANPKTSYNSNYRFSQSSSYIDTYKSSR